MIRSANVQAIQCQSHGRGVLVFARCLYVTHFGCNFLLMSPPIVLLFALTALKFVDKKLLVEVVILKVSPAISLPLLGLKIT